MTTSRAVHSRFWKRGANRLKQSDLPNRSLGNTPADVRFTPKSRHMQCTSACPLWARSGHLVTRRQATRFTQPTPNQISQKKIVMIDIPVDMTITDDTVLKYTLYC